MLHDIRLAFRLMRRTPSVTAIALLSTALSVSATAIVFTAIKSVLLNPLPYARPAELDPDQPVLLSSSMQSLIADTVADRRFITYLLGLTGCLALTLAIAGIYGVSSYTTSRRTQEIGIRMALGATRSNIYTLIFSDGFQTVVAGLALGFAFAIAAIEVLRSLIVGLEALNIPGLCLAACLVLLTTAAACWIPARRATGIDPMCALRQD